MFGVTIFRFDLLALNDAILADPAALGLTNITDPACPGCGFGIPAPGASEAVVPNPEEYLYWDTGHFTAPVHKFLGNAAADLVLAKRQRAGNANCDRWTPGQSARKPLSSQRPLQIHTPTTQGKRAAPFLPADH